MARSILVILLLLNTNPVLAAKQSIDLSGAKMPGFANLNARGLSQRASSSPYFECGARWKNRGFISPQPVATAEVVERGEFVLWLGYSQDPLAAALVHPDGKFTCIGTKREPTRMRLAKGVHKVFVLSDRTALSYQVPFRFERIGSDEKSLKQALASAVVIEVSDEGVNPVQHAVKPLGAVLRANKIGMSCTQQDQLLLVARVKLPVGSRWRFTNAGKTDFAHRQLYVRDASGKCVSGDIDAGEVAVFAPAYTLQNDASLTLGIEDIDRDHDFGLGPKKVLKKLETPLWIPIEKKMSAGPLAILSLTAPMRGLRFDVVAPGMVKARVLRPDRKKVDLGRGAEHPRGKLSVSAQDDRLASQVDAPAWLLVRKWPYDSKDFKASFRVNGDPLARPHYKKGALPIAHRELRYIFPFLPPTFAVDEIFLDAPKDLFLFMKRSSGTAQKGEPVLLVTFGEKKSTITRANGKRLQVRTERLSTSPIDADEPWSWLFDANKSPSKLATLADVQAVQMYLPLSSHAAFAKWRHRSMKIGDCIDRYMKKHDPAHRKNYELVFSNSGRNVSDVVYKRARKKCKANSHDRKGEALVRKALGKEKKRQKTLAAKLRKKLARP